MNPQGYDIIKRTLTLKISLLIRAYMKSVFEVAEGCASVTGVVARFIKLFFS